MASGHERRNFLRMVGGTIAGAGALAGAAACSGDEPTPVGAVTQTSASPGPAAPFPPGPLSSGTNVPRLAEAGQLDSGSHKHTVEVIWQVDTTQKLIALTFDDGPDPTLTRLLHDQLDETRARATFFLLGNKVAKYADVIKGRMDRHEVGNHTWDHESLFYKDQTQQYEDMLKAHQAIASVTGKQPRLLRPPYGHLNGNTMLAAGAMGYDIAMWSGYIGDDGYAGREDALVNDVVKEAVPGSIFLGHDSGDRRAIAVRNIGNIIRELHKRSYEFVTISELRQAQA